MGFETDTLLLALLICLSLFLYFVFGGADFGGGVWDLFASGPRKEAQRAWIKKAIGPVWEANHVWLIFAIVLLFSAFPRAFSAISARALRSRSVHDTRPAAAMPMAKISRNTRLNLSRSFMRRPQRGEEEAAALSAAVGE